MDRMGAPLQQYCKGHFFFGHTACGTLVPAPEIEPGPPAVKALGVLTTEQPGNSCKEHSYTRLFCEHVYFSRDRKNRNCQVLGHGAFHFYLMVYCQRPSHEASLNSTPVGSHGRNCLTSLTALDVIIFFVLVFPS